MTPDQRDAWLRHADAAAAVAYDILRAHAGGTRGAFLDRSAAWRLLARACYLYHIASK